MSILPFVLAEAPFGLPEPISVLTRAIVDAVGGALLVAAGIRLLVLFRQVTSADFRRWVAYLPFALSIPMFILAVAEGLAYRSVALTQSQLGGLDFSGLLDWQVRVNEASAGVNTLSTIFTILTILLLGGLVLYIVLTPPREDQ